MNTEKKKVYNRINDFINFHNVSSIADSIVIPFKKYCELANYTKEQKQNAALFYSMTYSVPSTIICVNKLKEIKQNIGNFWEENKEKLIFQTDKRWVKFRNEFAKIYKDFDFDFFRRMENVKCFDINKAIEQIEKNYYFSRFTAFLFLEVYCCFFDKKTFNNKLDWQRGSTVTSGLLDVLNCEKLADMWDKNKNVKINPTYFDTVVNALLSRVTNGKDLSVMETTLCAYRKLFKGSRYVGYYTDRVQEELKTILRNYPEYTKELSLLYEARKLTIPSQFLGENNNWNGIRKDLKKYYLENNNWKWWNND